MRAVTVRHTYELPTLACQVVGSSPRSGNVLGLTRFYLCKAATGMSSSFRSDPPLCRNISTETPRRQLIEVQAHHQTIQRCYNLLVALLPGAIVPLPESRLALEAQLDNAGWYWFPLRRSTKPLVVLPAHLLQPWILAQQDPPLPYAHTKVPHENQQYQPRRLER